MRAHSWRSGPIEFRESGAPCPEGALPLPDVPREVIETVARRAWDGETLLVPGVPEAARDDDAAVDALIAFCDFLASIRRGTA